MAGVVFIFVREDASDVEALADAFDCAGYSINGSDTSHGVLSIVVWSRAAARSPAFRAAVERALQSKRVVVASLAARPSHALAHGVPVVDISAWDGADVVALDPLFDAVADIARPVHANVIALPGPVYEDAEFTEAPVASNERANRASWDAPIPTNMLRPVHEDARAQEGEAPKLGAPSPRRDFRRLRPTSHSRAPAALAFAVVALIGGAAFAIKTPATGPSASHAMQSVEQTQQQGDTGGVSLSSASAGAIGLEDVRPVERPRLFAPAEQVGHAGVEPPSARSVRRAAYTPRYARHEDIAPVFTPTVSAQAESAPAPIVLAESTRSGPMF